MKVAIVHELLTMKGGAESVAKVFADHFPNAPIYTFLYDEAALGDWFPRERVRTSLLQQRLPWLPGRLRRNHHLHLAAFPAAAEAWDFSDYDLVLSSSSAFAHGIITNAAPKHISYVHSPARYLWDRAHDVLAQQTQPILGWLRRRYLATQAHRLRQWDSAAAKRADVLLAASKTVQRRIELYWRCPSTVLTPPIADFWLSPNPHPRRNPALPPRYLVVSTLARYKRIDLAISACNALKAELLIVGTGPDAVRLQRLAGPTVRFIGRQEGEDLRALYTSATATLFPGEEDFGLVPLESLSCGTPVVAYAGGGSLETLRSHSAEFFTETNAESLMQAIQKLSQRSFEATRLRADALPHTRQHFLATLDTHIAGVVATEH